jgi:hypothetical protein
MSVIGMYVELTADDTITTGVHADGKGAVRFGSTSIVGTHQDLARLAAVIGELASDLEAQTRLELVTE